MDFMLFLPSIKLASHLTLVSLPATPDADSHATVVEWLARNNVENVIIRSSNFGPGELEDKAKRVKEIANVIFDKGFQPYIAADQEGGRVQAMTGTAIPPPMDIDDDQLESMATLLAYESAQVGINLMLGPVLDIPCEGNFIGNRAFGYDPETVIRRAEIWIKALKTQILLITGKHFPGHGSTTSDTHKEAAHVEFDAKQMQDWEQKPFYALQHSLDAIMSAHVHYKKIDPHCIATYSKTIMTDNLKEFEGIRISDSLGMRAATPRQIDFEQTARDMAKNAIKAINAGCDLVIIGRPHYESDTPKLETHMAFVDKVLLYIADSIDKNEISKERLMEAYTRNQSAKLKIIAKK